MKREKKILVGFIVLQGALITLRSMGVILWSWWIVLAPMLPVAFVIAFAVLIFYLAGMFEIYKKVKKTLHLLRKQK